MLRYHNCGVATVLSDRKRVIPILETREERFTFDYRKGL